MVKWWNGGMVKGLKFIGLIVLMLLIGCSKQAPQIPSQRKSSAPQTDTAALALLAMNQRLAISADEQIRQFAMTQEVPYALYEAGAWMTVLDKGDTDSPSPKAEEEWLIHLRTYNLNGRLLLDTQGSYPIGRQELPEAVEANIGEMHRHGHVRMIVPWYTAYGPSGTNEVPPYENVIIEIELL